MYTPHLHWDSRCQLATPQTQNQQPIASSKGANANFNSPPFRASKSRPQVQRFVRLLILAVIGCIHGLVGQPL